MKHKIPRVAARFPAFWLILTVYLLEFGVPGPGQCHLILRQLSMWVPAVLGMMLMRLSGSYNMAVGAQMTFSAALLGVLAATVLRSSVGGLCCGAGCGRGAGDPLYSAVQPAADPAVLSVALRSPAAGRPERLFLPDDQTDL